MNGPMKVYSSTITSAATYAVFDLGRTYGVIHGRVDVATSAVLTVYGSADGTTYYPIQERINTATVQHQALTVATTASGSFFELGKLPFQYIKLIGGAAFVDGGSAQLICSSE